MNVNEVENGVGKEEDEIVQRKETKEGAATREWVVMLKSIKGKGPKAKGQSERTVVVVRVGRAKGETDRGER